MSPDNDQPMTEGPAPVSSEDKTLYEKLKDMITEHKLLSIIVLAVLVILLCLLIVYLMRKKKSKRKRN